MSEPPENALQTFIRKAIEAAPRARDHYDKKIQELSGTKGKPLYDLQRGKSLNPSITMLGHMAAALGQPLDLITRAANGEEVEPLAYGASPPAPPKPVVLAPDIPLTRSIGADDHTVELSSLDLSYSMGPGTELESYIEQEPIRFDPVFLNRISRAPYHRLKLARGVGDSMQPTLFPGDVVMIDTTQHMLNMQDRVYAIAINGAAAIKRLRMEKGGRISIVSDNPAVENYTIEAEELAIHGRVIWFGREI